MKPYRVFISYAHQDGAAVAVRISEALRSLGAHPTMDDELRKGHNYINEIKDFIDRSHLFIPILTPCTESNPWVHEEIGCAIGSGIPVLPVALGTDPGGMLTFHQAIKLDSTLSNIETELEAAGIEDTVQDAGENSRAALECADDPDTRTRILGEYANKALRLGSGRLRQRGAFSSFCLPNEHWSRAVWRLREIDDVRPDYYHRLQWEERKSLERHARTAGCDLLIDPTLPFDPEPKAQAARKARLQTLRDFIESMPEDKIRVAMNPIARDGNTVIVGDWFFGQSMSPKKGVGYLQTVFSWHAPRVLHEINQFDEMFRSYYDASGSSRVRSMEALDELIASIH